MNDSVMTYWWRVNEWMNGGWVGGWMDERREWRVEGRKELRNCQNMNFMDGRENLFHFLWKFTKNKCIKDENWKWFWMNIYMKKNLSHSNQKGGSKNKRLHRKEMIWQWKEAAAKRKEINEKKDIGWKAHKNKQIKMLTQSRGKPGYEIIVCACVRCSNCTWERWHFEEGASREVQNITSINALNLLKTLQNTFFRM